jgi:negative regulator of sigma E activity
MNDAITERLSRLLDGDLDSGEARETERAVAADPGLRGELDALTRVRSALQALAESEHAPPGLDARIGTLGQGSESSRPRRRLPWLAAAAAVVLGVTVGVQVLQRSPSVVPAGEPIPAALQAGEDEGALGSVGVAPPSAANRLEGAPFPEAAATAGEAAQPRVAGAPSQPLRERAGLPPGPAPEAPRALAAGSDTQTASAASKLSRPHSTDDGLDGRSTALDRAAAGRLLVFMGGDTAWQDFEPRVASVPGRHAVRVRVEGGVVRKVWPVWKPLAAPFDSLQASELVVGLAISGVPDGDYAGEVVIERPSTPAG